MDRREYCCVYTRHRHIEKAMASPIYRRSHCLLYVTVSGVHTAVLATIHLLGEKSLSLNGFQPTGTEASV